jgi:transposase InsO family protein
MGSRGDCYDNAVTEAFFATLACELLQHTAFRAHTRVRTALFEYIEGFDNPPRRHSARDDVSPAAYERRESGNRRMNPSGTVRQTGKELSSTASAQLSTNPG